MEQRELGVIHIYDQNYEEAENTHRNKKRTRESTVCQDPALVVTSDESVIDSTPTVQPSRYQYKLPAQIVDEVDASDCDDPDLCAAYIMDIHGYYKELEELFTVNVYMHMQTVINGKMRAILVDWIVEIHTVLKYATSTLYLACHIIDRYCMLEPVQRTNLQLVGVTAFLIACKYEEIDPPALIDCVHMTDNAYTREDIKKAEVKILKRLNWQITVPTTWTFLSRMLRVCEATELQFQRACYYSERVLQEHDMLAFRPSMIAASAVFLARAFDVGYDSAWTPLLETYTNLKSDHMNSCIHMMMNFVNATALTASNRTLNAVKKKFTLDRHLNVAVEPLPDVPKYGVNWK